MSYYSTMVGPLTVTYDLRVLRARSWGTLVWDAYVAGHHNKDNPDEHHLLQAQRLRVTTGSTGPLFLLEGDASSEAFGTVLLDGTLELDPGASIGVDLLAAIEQRQGVTGPGAGALQAALDLRDWSVISRATRLGPDTDLPSLRGSAELRTAMQTAWADAIPGPIDAVLSELDVHDPLKLIVWSVVRLEDFSDYQLDEVVGKAQGWFRREWLEQMIAAHPPAYSTSRIKRYAAQRTSRAQAG